MLYKLGRQPRKFNPAVPHMSSLRSLATSITLPDELNYADGMIPDLGIMLNDTLGDCTCAGYYHALQLWSFHTNKKDGMITEVDNDVLSLYQQACGYNPSDPNTDQGGNEQDVLSYLLNTGAPTGNQQQTRHKLRAFVETDPRIITDLKRGIYECGVVYLGIDVPTNIVPDNAPSPSVWDYVPNQQIEGGHCIIAVGYQKDGSLIISSWGQLYLLTPAFQSHYLDEAYPLCDIDWMDEKGLSLLGMSVKDLEAQMVYLKKEA
jgi:hypothetical protein